VREAGRKVGETGFILGSNAWPAPVTRRITGTQELLCPNVFRPCSWKSNTPWNGSGASQHLPTKPRALRCAVLIDWPPHRVDTEDVQPVVAGV